MPRAGQNVVEAMDEVAVLETTVETTEITVEPNVAVVEAEVPAEEVQKLNVYGTVPANAETVTAMVFTKKRSILFWWNSPHFNPKEYT